MLTLIKTLLNGTVLGSLYALVALGYTMVYGVLKFINFAHGDIVMIGAWFSFLIARQFHWNDDGRVPYLWGAAVVLVLAMLACALLGFLIERLAYRPLRQAPRLNVLIAAIGISLLIENLGQMRFLFGTETQPMAALLPDKVFFEDSAIPLPLLDIIIVGGTLVLMLGLDRLVFKTRMGLGMRAVAFDHRLAALMGVPVDRVVSLTFMLGSALAAAGGFFYALQYESVAQPAHPSWIMLGLKAFVAAVVGGIGNIHGAMVGGLVIGLIEILGARYLSSDLKDVYAFLILILVLLIRPTGIFGKAAVEKV